MIKATSVFGGQHKERLKIENALVSDLGSFFRRSLKALFPDLDAQEVSLAEVLERNLKTYQELKDLLSKHLQKSATFGLEIGQKQVNKILTSRKAVSLETDWDLMNEDVFLWLLGREGVDGYADLLTAGMLATNENHLRRHIGNWMQDGKPLSDLVKTLAGTTFGKNRAEAIAATEVTRAFAKGNNLAWKRSGIIQKQRWQTANDELVCPLCGPLNGTVISVDDTFFTGKNTTFEDGLPPRHSRCRCWITPVVGSDETVQPPTIIPPVLGLQYKADSQVIQDIVNLVEQRAKQGSVSESVMQAALTKVAEFVQNTPISINFHSRNLDDFFVDGRFKSQFETGSSGGSLDFDFRSEAEFNGLGYPQSIDKTQRPIYGWFNIAPDDYGASSYGDVEFVLKPEVKHRATFTVGDSLYSMGESKMVGSPVIGGFGKEIFDNQLLMFRDAIRDNYSNSDWQVTFSYIEAQIQNQVTLDDVERVIIKDIGRFSDVTDKHIQLLKDRGIPVEDQRKGRSRKR